MSRLPKWVNAIPKDCPGPTETQYSLDHSGYGYAITRWTPKAMTLEQLDHDLSTLGRSLSE